MIKKQLILNRMFTRKFISAGILILVFMPRIYAQTDSAVVARKIINLEQALADALPVDTGIWSKYLDRGWYIVEEDGTVCSKKEFLQTFKPFPKDISISVKVTRPVFSFHGDVLVIHYVADEHETAYGQTLHTTYGTMDTWYKTGDSWVMLAMQDFEIPALPPAIRVAPDVLRRYAGTYQLTGDKTAEVTLTNDTLFIKKNSGTRVALFPETTNVFFRAGDARGRKFFLPGDDGNLRMLERRNGQDIAWKKIK